MKEYDINWVDKAGNLRFIHIGSPITDEAHLMILTPSDEKVLEKLVEKGAKILVQGTSEEDIKSFQKNASIKSIYLKVDDKQAVLLREGNRTDYDYAPKKLEEIFPNYQNSKN